VKDKNYTPIDIIYTSTKSIYRCGSKIFLSGRTIYQKWGAYVPAVIKTVATPVKIIPATILFKRYAIPPWQKMKGPGKLFLTNP
jgi:hypothetical protein